MWLLDVLLFLLVVCYASAQTKPVISPSGVVPVVQGSNLTQVGLNGPDNVYLYPSTSSYSMTEGDTLGTITCFATCNPACAYTWSKSGSTVSYAATLDLGVVERMEAGSYVCVARNPGSNVSKSGQIVNVTVRYGPDNVSISPATTSYTVKEGDKLAVITCSATCYPACTYTWSRSWVKISSTATLVLSEIKRMDGGSYICTARNPESSASKDGPGVSVYVTYGPDNVSISPATTSYTVKQGDNLVVITCSATCYPACTYTWSRSGDTVSSTASLVLNEIERSEAGSYICTAWNRDSSVSKNGPSVSVYVTYGPYMVSVSPSTTSYSVTEGNNLAAITCSATCNPACTYTWSRSGSRVSSTATLYLRQIQRREAGYYICTVLNPESSISRNGPDVRVDVIYGPDKVSLSPSTTLYTVSEGNNLAAITCSATCNPACTYTWSKSESRVSSSALLYLRQIDRREDGSYMCTVLNPESSISKNGADVRVYVIYGPDNVSISPATTSYTVKEGDDLMVITCSATCYPACTYTWSRSGLTVSSTATLVLSEIERSEAGSYICTARNPDSSVSKNGSVVRVYVTYGPTSLMLNPSTLRYIKNEGDKLGRITCSADCFPECNILWRKTSGVSYVVSNNAYLFIGKLDRTERGTYRCEAINRYTRLKTTNTVTVHVRYSPDVFISESSALLNENTPLDLLCKASGVPAVYNYTGFLQRVNGIVIPNNHVESLGVRDSISVNIPYLQLQDTGLYTCFVHNGIIGINKQLIQTASKRVEVQASPKFLLEETNFAGETTENITIAIPFVSIPEYTSYSVIRHDGQPVSTNGKYTLHIRNESVYPLFYGQQIKLTGNVLEIIIRDLSEKDFGMYKIQITNDINTTDFSVDVRALSQPSPPTEMKLNTLDNKVKFEWKEGFNGGHAQTFVLETSPNSGDSWTKRLTIKESEPKYLNENGKIKVNLSNLDPGVYNARLVAFNIIGAIDPVEFKKRFEIMKLNQETLPRDSVGPVIGWTVGGIMAALVALIIIVVMIRRKYTCSNRFAKREDQSQSELRADIQGNANTENNAAQTSEVMAVTRDTGEYTDLKIRSNCPENTHFYMPLDESSSKSDVYYQNVKKEDPVYNNTVLKNSAQTEL